MPRKGKDFELAYADMYNLNKEKYKVKSPAYFIDRVTGSKREVDVLIKYKDDSGNERSIAVECRDRKHGEDVTSIEQLIKKKEDMEVDYYVVSTLHKFTKDAIIKARHYGVYIEIAEMISGKMVEKLEKDFFYDVFYIVPRVNRIDFILDDNSIFPLKKLVNSINIIDKSLLLDALDYQLLSNINIMKIIEKTGICIENFFDQENDCFGSFSNIIILKDAPFSIFKKLKIKGINYTLFFKPYRLSLPINKSLSTFEVGTKKNKAFKIVYGNDDEYVEMGYLDDKAVYSKAHLKPRKNHRVVGGDISVNTIFPANAVVHYEIDNVKEILANSFDYSDVL